MTDRPSKSARKREAQTIRELADRLVALKPDELGRMVDDADVLAAVREAQDIPSHGAGRRQRQYIAKLLRQIDTAGIESALAQANEAPAQTKRRFHAAERLRDALLAGNDVDAALADAGLDPEPELDSAVRDWRSAQSDAGRKKAAREVFRVVHAALEARDRAAGSG
ncbi:MAG: ribosome biogenesis factor YjgA [Pseudomonadota bacterium]